MKNYKFSIFGAVLAFVAINIAVAEEPDVKLKAEAKIEESTARKTALEVVPGGRVQSSELERENGLLIWSFDISKSQSKDITEVQVDAITGKIVSSQIETPEDQAREVKEDKGSKK